MDISTNRTLRFIVFMEILSQTCVTKLIFTQCSHFSNMAHQRYSATPSLKNTNFIFKFSIKDWTSPHQHQTPKQSFKRLMKWLWIQQLVTPPQLQVKSVRVMIRMILKANWKPEENWSRKFVKIATKLGQYCLLWWNGWFIMCKFRFNISPLIMSGLSFLESLEIFFGVQFSKQHLQTGCRTLCYLQICQKDRLLSLKNSTNSTWREFLHKILSQFCLSRQPNQQARQAAPFIKKKQIKTIENDESSVRFIVTRHPFHRFTKNRFLSFLNFWPQAFVSLQRQIGEVHTRFWLHKEKWLVEK